MDGGAIQGFPLSPQQRRLFSLQSSGEGRTWTWRCSLWIEGELDPRTLDSALELAVRRHEILRTSFERLPGLDLPLQVIGEEGFPWRLEDAGAGSCRLDLELPSLSTDETGLEGLLGEIARCYAAVSAETALADPPIQYAEIAAWLNQVLASDAAGPARRYWADQDLSALSALRLPFADDTARAPFRPDREATELDAEAIRTAAAAAGVPVDSFLLAAWLALLSRVAGQEVGVGANFSGRRYEEMAGVPGLVDRHLPVATRVDPAESFADLARRTEALRQQHDQWQEGFEPAEAPAFRCLFDYRPRLAPVAAGRVRFSWAGATGWIERFQVALRGIEHAGGLRIEIGYDTGCVSAADARRLAAAFRVLVEEASRTPERAVGDLALLDADERRLLAVELGATERHYPGPECLHQLVEEQVRRTPDRVALVYGDVRIDYAELWQRVERVAAELHARGVGPEVRVGLFLERSPEMVAGVLGTLAAGGVYVPLDPDLPRERLAWMARDAAPVVVLTTESLRESLPELAAPVVCLDRLVPSSGFSSRPVTGDHLAYLLYTSGTSGHPKGVMVSHRAIRNRLLWMLDAFPFEEGDAVLQKTPFGFDASIWELFVPLLCGARVVLARPGGHRDPAHLVERIVQEEVTHLQLVPSQLGALLGEPGLGACASLRRLFCGGEALPRPLVERFLSVLPGVEVVNLYGPTEAAIDAAFHRCSEGLEGPVVPLGRPIANAEVCVVDAGMEPLPRGWVGELAIGGAGLARGYAGRPDLTAAKFVPHPLARRLGERLYRSGDRARWGGDGRLEFLGRLDHQVKVRGVRIEPAEVEAALATHPQVSESAVVAREDAPGQARLVAYLVARGETAPTASELRAHLERTLPEAMIPTAWVTLPALPLGPHGKLDRQALPAADAARPELDTALLPPRTATEEALAEIWREVLGLERVGVRDDFFDLGGHSLLVIQVMARVRDTFSMDLPMHQLFRFPTIEALAAAVEEGLRQGLALRLPPLRPRLPGEPVPLSFGQQRLWFLHQLDPHSAAYNLPLSLRFQGRLDPGLLERTVSEVVRRHEVLRTVFPIVAGRATQQVMPPEPQRIPLVDLSALPPETGEVEGRRLAGEEARQPFDLARGPVLRVTLVRQAAENHLALVNLHHIASDGWSTRVLQGEVMALYEALREGRPSPLPDLPVQYADYAVWQRQWLQGEPLAHLVEHWRERLSGAPTTLEIPTDRPRSAVRTAAGAMESLYLDLDLLAAAQALGRRQGATPFIVFLSAFFLLLHRYSGQEDLLVGTAVANRTRRELEELIGFFVNTLVLRTGFAESTSGADLIRRVREAAFDAQAHQDLPFEKLVEELEPERSLARSPLFQVMFAFENVPAAAFELPGLKVGAVAADTASSKFDLSLSLLVTGTGLSGQLEFDLHLFERTTARRLLGHYETLLRALLAAPDGRAGELPLLSEAERRQAAEGQLLFAEPGAAARDYPGPECLHRLVEEQVRRTPSGLALVCGDVRLRYAELWQRVEQVAAELHRRGVGPEVRVGLCLERSPEMVAGVLGTLAAGGVYVPLDPDLPRERLSWMARDAGAAVVLTTESLRESLPELAAPVVCLDRLTPSSARSSGPVTGDHLAYLLYTSGTSGHPKGVMVSHRAIRNRLLWMLDTFPFEERDAVLQKTPFGFDASIWELFVPLLCGARVVLARPGGHRDPAHLVERIVQEEVTHLQLVPSQLGVLLGEPGLGQCVSLRRLFCGGEALPWPLVERFLSILPGVEVVNLYGPTEAAIDAAFHRCAEGMKGPVVPLGRPIGNAEVWVVDAGMEPLPWGWAGELAIGGVGLARGYAGQPGLTAAKFVPHPLAKRPGERLYRSGDRARWSRDGRLEFLGRLDHQVKVRGVRVEPAEVEAALATHAQVSESAVVAREDVPGQTRLVAYLVTRGEGAPTPGELRAHLGRTLPEAMIPSVYVTLPALPLGPHGKLDRKALPAAAEARPEPDSALLPPRTAAEEALAEIWREVLGLEQVGVRDDFFDLGGHSLLAVQVMTRARDTFAIDVPLHQLFHSPTVEALAGVVEEGLRQGLVLRIPPLRPRPPGEPAPLSFGQQRLWFLHQLEPHSPAYNLPISLRFQGPLEAGLLERAISEVVRRHEVLRTVFPVVAGQATQRVLPPEPQRIPLVDFSALPREAGEAEGRRLAGEEARQPFDLARGPVLRATLVRQAAEDHLALVNLHHIASDGWSTRVLRGEVMALYEALREGRPSPFPELPVQYADYAVWQRQWLQGEALAQLVEHWRERLAGAPSTLELPTDRPRSAVRTAAGAAEPLYLDVDLLAAAQALGRRQGATPFIVFLSAFFLLLHRYSGQEDLLVGTPVANRTRRELEGLIGFFVNTLVLRAGFAESTSGADLIRRVREAAFDAQAYQDLPFEKLVEELEPERSLARSPLFQVMFAFENVPAAAFELPGLKVGAVAADTASSKFDLSLSLLVTGTGLSGQLEFDLHLFERTTARRLLGHYETLLRALIAAPDGRAGELPLLSDDERHQVLRVWAGGSREPRPEVCLHRRFEAQADDAPEAVAVEHEGVRLTYGELEERANRLAHHLIQLGVGPEVMAALLFEPSPDMIVAILGVLKAGGAYVPLDPAQPSERLRLIVEDTRAELLLTVQSLAGRLGESPARAVRLDGDLAADLPATRPAAAAGPGNAAYVIHTSGSTGRPKGVVVQHGNVDRLLTSTRDWFDFGPRDVWTLFHSYTFDFSVWEIWGALAFGGRLVVVPHWITRSPQDFLALLRSQGVTVLNQTPSSFRQLLQAGAGLPEHGLALRYVVFGGEALDPRTLRPWFMRQGDGEGAARLVNMFGITETTVHVTWRPLRRADAEVDAGSVIGVPIPDLRVYVLDAGGQPLPAGVPGEAWVAGPGVARGYLGRPELTAERFVPDPWSDRSGERAYRTGDLVRFRPDGELEYLGRIDHQVKVRGFRIELGEIEAALACHPGVREAAVLAREDEPGDRRLVAYLVTAGGAAPAVEEMRAFLERSLPLYMIPAAFVPVAELPLTPNGKLDRGALPAPGLARPGLGQEYAPPRTAAEEVLCQIWSQILGVERVGIHDNFFALGGDSILSLRVRALAEERGLRFSLQDLFLRQSIAELARHLTLEDGPAPPERLPPFCLIAPEDRPRLSADVEDAYPLTAVQAGMLYHMSYQPGAMVYHNVYSYHLRAPFDAAAFDAAVQISVARHPILRTSFDLAAYREPLQLVHRTAVLSVEVEDLRHVPAEEQERFLDEFVDREKHRPFDLSCPPLVRFALHRRSDESFNFSLAECHPIFDGWSLHSFLTEVLETYFALLDGRVPAAASPLRLSIAEFVALERATVESPECRDYWNEALRDAPVLALPRWNPDSVHGGQRIQVTSFRFPPPLCAGLRELSRWAAVPLKSVLLAAHLRAMSLAGGERDVVTGMVCNGRPEGLDGDRILGLFFNTVPFRLDLENGTWFDLVRAVFDAERRMLPFRRYPLAQLQKSRGGKPLFEVLFNYIHFYMMRDVLGSGRVQVLGDFRRWEETNLTFSTTFVQDPVGDGLTLVLRYDSQEIGAAQVEQIRGLYEGILRAMAGAPGERHEAAALLSEAERHQLLVEWNDTPSGPESLSESGRCLHELFEARVEQDGAAPALAFEGEVLTYSELNARANRLARYLRGQGVGPEARVGLYTRRSLDTVVGLLGVLKAGGAYVPLDPLSPPERVARALADAGVSLVLTQERLAADLPPGAPGDIAIFRLDADAASLAGESGENPAWPLPAACAAYVLFTSGSTGAPKGVVVEHRQIVRYVRSAVERLEIEPGWSFAVISTFSADLGNTVIFPALCTGGCLHVLSEERAADAAALEEYASRFPVDVLKIVPSHLSALLASPNPGRLLPRRRLVLGGEALEAGLVRSIAALDPSCRVFNHYGPTETTVGVTACRAEPDPRAATVPLGRPLGGTRIHLLDRGLRLASPGAPGELCIAGEGLARGYLGHPAATAEKFAPNPCGGAPGERLYRTGDRARRLPDGRIEFLGRLDGQIKIRGFRIELQEIELSLARHHAVRESAVVLRNDQAGEKRLVAFCAAAGDDLPSDLELRGFLRRLLPEYMLPVAFVWLRELPRSPNGKLDRRALPEVAELKAWRTPYVAPRNELESAIARVWQEVLQLQEVGRDDNFFDLGGHSLFMLRIHSTLRNVLQRDVAMMDLFEHPTVGSLAGHLSQGEAEAAPSSQEQERAAARHAAVQRRRQAAAERRG